MFKLIGLCLFEVLWLLSNLVLKPRKLTCDKVYQREAERGKFNAEAYQALRKTKFNLTSDYGYVISCEQLETESAGENNPDRKIAILCHGFSYAKYGCLIYAEVYLKLGFTVIIYDHRNHGLSGKAFTSMGHFEKHDLKKVVDWCCKQYGKECTIVTHGESMGAATVLLHLGIDNRVKCAVADCAYSDLKELLRHQSKQYYHLPHFLILVESLITYLRAGFWYREVSPIKIVRQTDTPILFIHGKKDCYVPTVMSKQMYACKRGRKAIYLVAGAKHAESCFKNRSGYEKVVEKFLKTYL